MRVEYALLNSAQDVLERQADNHLPRMGRYICEYGHVPPWDLGLILAFLHPLNEAVVAAGSTAIDAVAGVYRLAAHHMQGSLTQYIEADQAVHDAVSKLAQSFGVSVPPFVDPRGSLPALGPASGGAGDGYGAGEPNLFAQASRDGAALRSFIDQTPGRITDRLDQLEQPARAIQEHSDASSFLVPPVSATSAIEDMRWSAGPILGSVDWVFEKLFGFSLIEDVVMRQFAGDWSSIDKVSIAWSHVDDSLVAVASNCSGLCPALATWEGRGSEAALGAMTAVAAGTTALSYAAGFVSQIVARIATVAKAVAAGIGMVLSRIGNHLLMIAAEAAVPVVGWALAVANAAIMISDILSGIKLAYTLVNLLYDAISSVIEAKEKIVEVGFIIADLVEGLGRGVAVRTS